MWSLAREAKVTFRCQVELTCKFEKYLRATGDGQAFLDDVTVSHLSSVASQRDAHSPRERNARNPDARGQRNRPKMSPWLESSSSSVHRASPPRNRGHGGATTRDIDMSGSQLSSAQLHRHQLLPQDKQQDRTPQKLILYGCVRCPLGPSRASTPEDATKLTGRAVSPSVMIAAVTRHCCSTTPRVPRKLYKCRG